MALTETQLYTIQIFSEAVLYGIYCVLFAVVLYLLIKGGRTISRPHVGLFVVAILMFMLSSAHMFCFLVEAIAEEESAQIGQATVAIANIHVLLGDCILIWRAWVVWGHNYWIALVPVIIVALSAAFGFYATAAVTTKILTTFPLPTAILSAVNTMLCTSLIVGRILYIQHQTSKFTGTRSNVSTGNVYHGVALLLIDSGALYTAALLTALILFSLRSQGLQIILGMNTPLIGIIPTLIIVLVHLDMVPGTHANEQYLETLRTRGIIGRLGTIPLDPRATRADDDAPILLTIKPGSQHEDTPYGWQARDISSSNKSL